MKDTDNQTPFGTNFYFRNKTKQQLVSEVQEKVNHAYEDGLRQGALKVNSTYTGDVAKAKLAILNAIGQAIHANAHALESIARILDNGDIK
jgi:hypothetical protein